MGMFIVPAGVNVRAVPPNQDWHPSNIRETRTTKTNVFEKHEVILDPATGKLSGDIARMAPKTIGASYEGCGWYGFKCATTGWTMLVHHNNVEYA